MGGENKHIFFIFHTPDRIGRVELKKLQVGFAISLPICKQPVKNVLASQMNSKVLYKRGSFTTDELYDELYCYPQIKIINIKYYYIYIYAIAITIHIRCDHIIIVYLVLTNNKILGKYKEKRHTRKNYNRILQYLIDT